MRCFNLTTFIDLSYNNWTVDHMDNPSLPTGVHLPLVPVTPMHLNCVTAPTLQVKPDETEFMTSHSFCCFSTTTNTKTLAPVVRLPSGETQCFFFPDKESCSWHS